ncbi:MAG: glycosyltransferase family A protein [Candidatus Bathyarchaeia archaeon]
MDCPPVLALVPTRDGGRYIGAAIRSLCDQTVRPRILVIDDASRDDTPRILESFGERIEVLRLSHDLPRDFRRIPSVVNEGLKRRRGEPYIMIAHDDCTYPPGYIEAILSEFSRDPSLVVASGGIKGAAGRDKAPVGAGRIIRADFLDEVGGRFPENDAWESWLLFKALRAGRRIACLDWIEFDHNRPYGRGSLWASGRGLYELGYPFSFVLARSLKTLLIGDYPLASRWHILYTPLGYLEMWLKGRPRIDDPDLMEFVREVHRGRLRRFPMKLLRRILLRRAGEAPGAYNTS